MPGVEHQPLTLEGGFNAPSSAEDLKNYLQYTRLTRGAATEIPSMHHHYNYLSLYGSKPPGPRRKQAEMGAADHS